MEISKRKKVLSYCEALVYMWKNEKKLFSLMSTLQTYYNLKLDFQKVDQHTVRHWNLVIKLWK